jgi:hypothetical protein
MTPDIAVLIDGSPSYRPAPTTYARVVNTDPLLLNSSTRKARTAGRPAGRTSVVRGDVKSSPADTLVAEVTKLSGAR